MGIGSHTRPHRGATNDWLTPPALIEALGPFDLDPCCPECRMPWPTAARMLCPPADGLELPWQGRVWLNPPYGPLTGHWLKKLAAHGNGIALIFARTETAFFQRWVFGEADALFFPAGRLHFYLPDGRRARGNAGGPSVLAAYGQYNAERLKRFGRAGTWVPRGTQ